MLSVTHLSRGVAWLDTGSPKTLHDAGTFVRIIEERTGMRIACLEEIALNKGWISAAHFEKLVSENSGVEYYDHLRRI